MPRWYGAHLKLEIAMLDKFWFNFHAVVAHLCERELEVMVCLTRCVEKATIYHYRKSQPR